MANLLNMSGGSLLRKGLHYDAKIEYLESTGTQWIDTGITQGNNTISAKILPLNYPNPSYGYSFFGIFSTYKDHVSYVNSYGTFTAFGTTNEMKTGLKMPKNTQYQIVFDRRGVLKVNNSIYRGTASPSSVSNVTYYIFTRNYGSGEVPTITTEMRLYDFSIRSNVNENLLIDLIPVRKGNVGYMYDKVSGQLFGNAGTGDFILGPDK